MPHMMPMMWMLTLISSMLILFFILSMTYFLFIPYPSSLDSSSPLKYMKIKWIWKW